MDSVTQWIASLKQSDCDQAAEQLWARYVNQMLALAGRKLGSGPRSTADEEDVAVTAFETLLRGIRQDRFTRLNDRNDLWQVLVMLTERRAVSQRRSDWALKRGGGEMIRELSTELISAEPTPDQAAQFAEEVHSRLADLPGKLERTIAIRRMQGHSNSEIAEELDVSQRTVERKLNLIRQMWS